METVNAHHLLQVHERIRQYIHATPVLTSRLLDDLSGAKLFFKCETFQRMGAFKMRGAANAILCLPEKKRELGVVTHSSGNFAQAISLAASSLGVKAYIVMPDNTPAVKKAAVAGYGGIIHLCDASLEAREKKTSELVRKTGASFIHPSNDLQVILGQATAGMELLNIYPNLEHLVVPVGGGGLLAGTALGAHFFGMDCKVSAGEPANADDAYRSLSSGKIQHNNSANTIADGLRTELGNVNFPIIKEYVEDIIRVNEEEIVTSMKMIWERLKITAEPSSAVALAAVLKQKEKFLGKRVGIIISGGNVDLNKLPF